VSDGTTLEGLRCLRLDPDKSHGKNQPPATGGAILAISTGSEEVRGGPAEAPATGHQRRSA
jgi:hypothetical protein